MIVFFALGSTAYVFRDAIPISYGLAAVSAVAMAASIRNQAAFSIVLPIALSYLTMFLACKLPFKRIDSRFDLSYGVYIYAFPIQQLLAMYGVNRQGLGLYVILALLAAAAVAAVSWIAVERPALQLKGMTFRLTRDAPPSEV